MTSICLYYYLGGWCRRFFCVCSTYAGDIADCRLSAWGRMKRAVGVKDFAVKYLFFEFSLRHGGGVGNLDNRLFVLLFGWA